MDNSQRCQKVDKLRQKYQKIMRHEDFSSRILGWGGIIGGLAMMTTQSFCKPNIDYFDMTNYIIYFGGALMAFSGLYSSITPSKSWCRAYDNLNQLEKLERNFNEFSLG